MNRLIFLLFASLLVLSACGNEKEKEEPKKETKEKKVDKDKGDKKKQDKEVVKQSKQQSDEQPNSQEQTVEQPQQPQNNNGYQQPEQQASQNYASQQETPVVNKNTVTEYYNGQTHTTTNNPVREEYVEGETDPIYEHEYKHFYTPEEAQRAKEESDRILIEDGLEPGHYE
ncbi:TPA: hypothetical protein RJQ36_001757 [Staphylococcus pseudintermedius]|uniref:hypothetical protein n=1 Tax=Staphylococcus pseudintermedius TaxID=283734 RepID=UPI0019E0702D|nr:hypothetical protein [Staphylococcus pseudintermedius]EGQ3136464.1 hypothetical protein [Staphylococcus pseudintermedius]EGQ3224770.1 hypothetical protein [Staphylococcus pseudintermedius]EGQ3732113.1 hypothetical protein [Staphylococcus pseudintermedius]EGQ3757120.1 hypothetical protein [Staphylococcus pseudintermedius]EGQ3760979.1 hypothetical protein [Staphylococcus pseudintermedius]